MRVTIDVDSAVDILVQELDFSRKEIKDMINDLQLMEEQKFIGYYNSLKNTFKSQSRFLAIDCEASKINWPPIAMVFLSGISISPAKAFLV